MKSGDRCKTKERCDAHAKKAHSIKMKATEPKGRHNQPRGSAKHNTEPRHAKPFGRSGKTDFDEKMVF